MFQLRPISRRRLDSFIRNRRGFYAFWIFIIGFFASLGAELIANDRPIVISYKGEILFPIAKDYPEDKFGGSWPKPIIAILHFQGDRRAWLDALAAHPLFLRHAQSLAAHRRALAADLESHRRAMRAGKDFRWTEGDELPRHRMELAWHRRPEPRRRRPRHLRLPHFRAVRPAARRHSSVVGIAAGAVQGYFGGWTDLLFQRFIEIWSSLPSLYLLIILSAIITPSFFVLLGILLAFSWVNLVHVVRAEFLRARNFDYVRAARALGLSNSKIMMRHVLPNAMVATLTFLPSFSMPRSPP